MFISVQFYGVQRKHTGTSQIRVPILKNGLVSDVLLYLKDSYPDLQLNKKEILVSVNNEIKTMDHVLDPDDQVLFLPHIGGG